MGGLPAVGSGRRNSISGRDEGWQAGYSALMQAPGAKAVQEVSSSAQPLFQTVLVHCTSVAMSLCQTLAS